MASEIFKPDANFKAGGVVGGYSSADALEATNPTKIVFRINPTTKRLLVDVNGATTVTDGEAVDAADTGTLFLGTDGTNYQLVKTDSDGNLQVDVLTMPAVTIDTSLLATSAKQDTIIGHVDGIEGLLTTIDADTGNIVGYLDGVEGLLTTIDADTGNIATSVASIDSKTPALGQALAAGSVPVVLTAAQISTLTPLSTVAVTQSGTWDEVGINDSGNSITVDAPVATPVFVRLSDGAAAITTLPVSLASVPSHAVTNAGTFVVQENGAALTALQLIDNAVSGAGFNITQFGGTNVVTAGVSGMLAVGGNIAHDTADTSNPLKIGFKAESSPKGITLVADGDRSDAYGDVDGLQMFKLDTSNDDVISERVSNTDGASTAFTNFGAVASTHNCIRTIVIWNSSSTNGYVDFRDGTGGSILWTMPAPATGGSILPPTSPFAFRTSQNTALAFDVSAALTTVYISVSGYQSKS